MKFLKQIFARKGAEAMALYRIPKWPMAMATGQGLAIGKILAGELDGFVVPDFLSGEECVQLIAGFRALRERELVRVDAGFTSHPMAFAQFDQAVRAGRMEPETYHRYAMDFRAGFAGQFGLDLEGRICELLGQMGVGLIPGVPADAAGHGSFIPFTFRELLPGKGTLKAHCEHLFFQEFPGFFERFSHFTQNAHQLSFFVVLQAAGAGGALTLYDLLWEEGQRRPTDRDIHLPDGRRLDVEDPGQLSRIGLRPGAGALVVFAGGKIWHRVETVQSAPSRITVGGFLSFSHDYRRIYLWS